MATMATVEEVASLLGKHVVIEWPSHREGVDNESAAGVLEAIRVDEDGDKWACLDWGYGVDVSAITRIAEEKRG